MRPRNCVIFLNLNLNPIDERLYDPLIETCTFRVVMVITLAITYVVRLKWYMNKINILTRI